MCDPCSHAVYTEQVQKALETLPYGAGKKQFLYVLDVDLPEYDSPIATDDYLLIKVDGQPLSVLSELLELCNLDNRHDVIGNAKYLLATDASLDLDRVECHLHNRFGEELGGFVRSVLCSYTTRYGDWGARYRVSENRLSITAQSVDEILTLCFGSHKEDGLDAIDVRFIIDRLEQDEDHHLYRGINRHYLLEDGIQASNYRFNPDLAECGTLQDHEREIVENLSRRDFYKDEANPKVAALTDLRHYGKETCILDFSEDPKIALFFACQGGSIAEILLLDVREYEAMNDIRYPVKDDFILHPAKTETARHRVEAQKSVFLYCHIGYAARSMNGHRIGNLVIAPSLKPILSKYCEHSDETIYPDFHAFIQKPENFMTEAKRNCQSKLCGEENYVTNRQS